MGRGLNLHLREEESRRLRVMENILSKAITLADARARGLEPVTTPQKARVFNAVVGCAAVLVELRGLAPQRTPELVRVSGAILEVWALPPARISLKAKIQPDEIEL